MELSRVMFCCGFFSTPVPWSKGMKCVNSHYVFLDHKFFTLIWFHSVIKVEEQLRWKSPRTSFLIGHMDWKEKLYCFILSFKADVQGLALLLQRHISPYLIRTIGAQFLPLLPQFMLGVSANYSIFLITAVVLHCQTLTKVKDKSGYESQVRKNHVFIDATVEALAKARVAPSPPAWTEYPHKYSTLETSVCLVWTAALSSERWCSHTFGWENSCWHYLPWVLLICPAWPTWSHVYLSKQSVLTVLVKK